MRVLALAAAAAVVLCASSANAAITVFTDRASFDAATHDRKVIDFEACPGGNATFTGSVGCIGVGQYFISGPVGSGYYAAPGQSTNPTQALGVNLPAGGFLDIVLAPGAFQRSAFGVNLFQNLGGGAQSPGNLISTLVVSFEGGGGQILQATVAPNGGSFFGFVSDETVNRVQIGTQSAFAVIDDVTFGAAGPAAGVPEPATWMTLILGFGLIGAVMRKRRRLPSIA